MLKLLTAESGGRVLRKRINPDELELEENVVQINRVAKVVKGGRTFSFSTVVVVGDGKGHVGVGMGKSREVPEAIRKGVEAAKKNLIRIPLSNTTIPHEVETKFAASRVRLLPAAPGTGVIAGRGVRRVVELAGIKDVLSKRYGSNNPVNVVKATFQALQELTSLEEQARMRDMTPRELNQRRSRRKTEKQEA
jgi:small subunit ribosomal protein S5